MNYKIIGKYIKQLDFKIPNPKVFSLLSKNISNYKINIDIKSNQIKDRIIEVETALNLTPSKDEIEEITTKIIYSTIIEINDALSTDSTESIYLILRKLSENSDYYSMSGNQSNPDQLIISKT